MPRNYIGGHGAETEQFEVLTFGFFPLRKEVQPDNGVNSRQRVTVVRHDPDKAGIGVTAGTVSLLDIRPLLQCRNSQCTRRATFPR
ncbi:MAG: hypothetical protein DMG97_08295 [Acidobacteria bacterium]|nr:MAG: hypothetical protein DMG97_08295 [Acidobacteriota bacterium]